jgi:beta-lactamase regulating signal transducer with metallopeptidase domain
VAVFIGVALASTIGWLISLALPRSAARRHLVLTTALTACLLWPIASGVRWGTRWTLLAIPGAAPVSQPASNTMAFSEPPLLHEPVAGEDGTAVAEPPGAQMRTVDSRRRGREGDDGMGSRAASDPPARVSQVRSTSPRVWPTIRTWGIATYLLVAGTMLVRLALSVIAARRARRTAIAVDVLSDGVRVLEGDVLVPHALGFGAPAILLPRGFRAAASPEALQDVLCHEREHLRRCDHWMLLAQGFAAALYWPIVTVHLLNRSLVRAREELCDNAVLGQRDATAYGRTLLAVAERACGRLAVVAPLAPSILRRGELERRVASLLDGRRDRRTRVSRQVRSVACAGVLAAIVLAGTTRVVADAAPGEGTPADALASAAATIPAPKADIAWTGIPLVDQEHPTLHRGVVLGPDGAPLAGARVYAASTIELLEKGDPDAASAPDLGPVRAVTDAEGRFEFDAPDISWVTPGGKRKRWETLLVATKEGVVSGWLKTWGADRSLREHWHPRSDREVAVRTRPPATLTGRLLLEGGAPLAGARVRVTGLMAPVDYDLEKHIPKEEVQPIGMFGTTDYEETIYKPRVLPGLNTEATTDNDGRFELPGLPEGFLTTIEVTHPDAEASRLYRAIRAIEPVYREASFEPKPTKPSLVGTGFTSELPRGVRLRGQVRMSSWMKSRPVAGVTVALANHYAEDGMVGQRFTTDEEGRFEMTGLQNWSGGYDLAFAGSFATPFASTRKRVFPDAEASVDLTPALRYRLTLVDVAGKPIDRVVYSTGVQSVPGSSERAIKDRFNSARRVAPGVYEGLVPSGSAAVLVKRRAMTDRPAAVDGKAFFAPGRTDWTADEVRYAYGDAWRIARTAVLTHDEQGAEWNPTIDQLELAAVVFTNEQFDYGEVEDDVLELTATVHSDPPVKVMLVDEAGAPVEGARVERQFKRYDGDGLPGTIDVYGLHPTRAERLIFTQKERGLMGAVTTTWTGEPVRVVMRPTATLLGRLVDKSGGLNDDFGIRVMGDGVMPDAFVAGRNYLPTDKLGERQGEFRLDVPPGMVVSGEFFRKSGDWHTRPAAGGAFGPVTLAPGERVDLGDLVVP